MFGAAAPRTTAPGAGGGMFGAPTTTTPGAGGGTFAPAAAVTAPFGAAPMTTAPGASGGMFGATGGGSSTTKFGAPSEMDCEVYGGVASPLARSDVGMLGDLEQ